MKRPLSELKASAPRTFDKELLDLLVSIQYGGKPIEAEPPREIVREVVTQTETLPAETVELIQQLAADNAALLARLAAMQEELEKQQTAIQYLARHAVDHIHTGPHGEPMAFVVTNQNGEVVRILADSRKPLEAA